MPHKLLKGPAFPHSLQTAPLSWLDPCLCACAGKTKPRVPF